MKTILKSSRYLAAICIVLLVCGCATPTQKLSEENRAKYTSVRIKNSVSKAPSPYLMAPSGANLLIVFGGALGGAVGGGLAGGLTASGKVSEVQVFNSFVEKNSISIENIAREEVESALRQSNKFRIAHAEETTVPELQIFVPMYGFSVPHLLSSNVVPVLSMKCDMKNSSGDTLWSASDRLLPSIASPMEVTSWEMLGSNPKIIEEQWRKAAKYVAQKIIQEL